MEKKVITQLEQLIVNSSSKIFLREISKWAKFLSIISFIGIGLLFIFSVFIKIFYNSIVPNIQVLPFDLGIVLLIYSFIIGVLCFIPSYYLLQFSNKIKKALETNNDETLSNALELLKSYYKFIGVFMIIIISLYVLSIVVSIMGITLL